MSHLSPADLVLFQTGDDAADRADLSAHLANCAHCRAELDAIRRTLEAFDAVEAPDVDPGYGQRVWNLIESRLDVPPVPTRLERGWSGRFRDWWPYAAMAAATAGMLALVVSAPRRSERWRARGAGVPARVRARRLRARPAHGRQRTPRTDRHDADRLEHGRGRGGGLRREPRRRRPGRAPTASIVSPPRFRARPTWPTCSTISSGSSSKSHTCRATAPTSTACGAVSTPTTSRFACDWRVSRCANVNTPCSPQPVATVAPVACSP